MRVGTRPPSRRPWLPPAFEGGPGLRLPRRPRRLAEVKPGCCWAWGGVWPARVGRAGQGGRRRRSEVKGGSAPPGGGLALPGGAPCFAPGQPLQRHLQKWPRPMPRRPEGCGKRGGRRPRGAEWLGDLGSALACMEPVMPLLWGSPKGSGMDTFDERGEGDARATDQGRVRLAKTSP